MNITINAKRAMNLKGSQRGVYGRGWREKMGGRNDISQKIKCVLTPPSTPKTEHSQIAPLNPTVLS